MQIRTIFLTVTAPRDTVFNFLADIENLPRWAAGICERLELRQGRWWAYTALGEMFVDMETSAGTGVIDLRAGPTPDRLGVLPIRVLPLPARGTLVSFTCVQPPGLSDELYEKQYQSLLGELPGLVRRFGGGKLHTPPVPELAAPGLN